MKPLDFVKTPKGAFAIITNKELIQGNYQYGIAFIGYYDHNRNIMTYEKNSWWVESDLTLIDNLPSLLARCVADFRCSTTVQEALKDYPNTGRGEITENIIPNGHYSLNVWFKDNKLMEVSDRELYKAILKGL